MADIYLFPADRNQAATTDEFLSALRWPSAAAATRLFALLATLDDGEVTPLTILEVSRELAATVSAQLRDNKQAPQAVRAVLNDVPASARGALEDAFKAVNIAPTYYVPAEQGGFEFVNPGTDRAVKRPNPVLGIGSGAPLDLHGQISPDPANGYVWPEMAKDACLAHNEAAHTARDAATIRLHVDALALVAKEVFDQSTTPPQDRKVLIAPAAHLTGALESALARQGLAAVHLHSGSGKLVQGATLQSGVEQRGLKAVRDAFGQAGKGVSDNHIRQALGAECIQVLGQLPPSVVTGAANATLAQQGNTVDSAAQRVELVLAAVKGLSPATPRMLSEAAPGNAPAQREPRPDAPPKAQPSREPSTPPRQDREQRQATRSLAEDGLTMLRVYLAAANSPRPGDKLAGALEKDIARHIHRETLESIARDGLPSRAFDRLHQLLAARAATANTASPDKLDVVYLCQLAMNPATESASWVVHAGQKLCTMAQLREALVPSDASPGGPASIAEALAENSPGR